MKLDPRLLKHECLIDGKWRPASDSGVVEVTNPSNGAVIGAVPNFGADETREAILAAKSAMANWQARTAKDRATILRRWFELIIENTEALAEIMTAEQGKPLAEARGEVSYGASFIEWFAEEGKRVYGDVIPSPWGDKRIVVVKQPVGVVAAITPWNFPIAMITRKVGPALAAGCTCVVKPASATPFSALAIAALAEQAGVPPG
ncbi:MAG: aldehyde dehydrogenase family protein, partial [Gammaproteobacteria bacterium]|nr:aldehyde dehydrogenase family protein [Gammaproteobacteria bacterium]